MLLAAFIMNDMFWKIKGSSDVMLGSVISYFLPLDLIG